MNQAEREWLLRHRRKLESDLEPAEVADYLYQHDCLNLDDMERIERAVTRVDKVHVMLEKLPLRSRHGLEVLLKALEESADWLLHDLEPLPAPATQAQRQAHTVTRIDNALFMRLTKRAEVLGGWRGLGRMLGLSEADLLMLASDHQGERESAHQMLVRWQTKNGRRATPQVLIHALRECELDSLADELEGK